MVHPDLWPLIDAYADGALEGADAERLEEHLRQCEECSLRLAAAQQEVAELRAVLAPADPPADLRPRIMARITDVGRAAARAMRPAIYAGVAANLITATILLLLSLGTRASLPLMLLVALLGALLLGGLKGLAFAVSYRLLPSEVLLRGLLFGLGLWIVSNVLLAAAGGADSLSLSFVLIGSLIHHLLFGVLISLLYDRITSSSGRSRWEGWSRSPRAASCLIAVILLVAPLQSALPRSLNLSSRASPRLAARQALAAPPGSPTSTPDAASITPTATPLPTASPTVTATGGPSPTPSGTAPAATATLTIVTTAGTPSPTAVPSPTAAPTPTRSPRRAHPSAREQLRHVLPAVVAPPAHRTATQRVRDILVLVNFL